MRLSRATFAAGLALAAVSPAAAAPTPAPPKPPFSGAPFGGQAPARVIYRMEQIQTGPLPPAVITKLGPLNTLDQVEDLLKTYEIPFAWRRADFASEGMPPDLLRQLIALPPHEVFVIPGPQGVLIGVILQTR